VLLNRLLDLGEEHSVLLAEESLQDLLDLPATAEILGSGLDADACIEIQGLGRALHLSQPAEFWLLLTDKYSIRKIPEEYFDELGAESRRIVQVEESDFFLALTEYFALSMAGELFCESCPVEGAPLYVKDRIERLKGFLEPLIPQEASILEVGCGSGMATQALLQLGCHPMSMDSDRCDLCQALKSGLMAPRSSFVLDARLLPCFFPTQSFQTVLGFMVGLIDDFNWALWRDILLKASSLAKERILFTVYTQKEAELIAKALGNAGWNGEVIDNRDSKGIYDQWAYLGLREG
jgi:hypothetical protein